jgi:hypothetical protein
MVNPMKLSSLTALVAAGFLFSSPAQAGTLTGTTSLGTTSLADEAPIVEKVGYRSYSYKPHKRFHKKRFVRRHAYPYRYRAYRHYYDDDDIYVYRRPAVKFGLGVRKHRYHNDYDDD